MIKRNLLTIALLLSLAANLFFIGGIGMRMLRVQDIRDARPLPPNLGWIIRDLDEDRRAELADEFRSVAEEIAPLRREILNAQRRVNSLITAEPFDADALSAAFADLRAASDHYQQVTQDQTSNILAQLTAAEREAARDFLRRRGPRDGMRDGPRDGPRPPRPEPD